MPVYEYVCKSCGSHFDVIRSMKDADTRIDCKKCQSSQTHRALSVFFAHSGSRSVTPAQHSCGGCSGGSCSGCKH